MKFFKFLYFSSELKISCDWMCYCHILNSAAMGRVLDSMDSQR